MPSTHKAVPVVVPYTPSGADATAGDIVAVDTGLYGAVVSPGIEDGVEGEAYVQNVVIRTTLKSGETAPDVGDDFKIELTGQTCDPTAGVLVGRVTKPLDSDSMIAGSVDWEMQKAAAATVASDAAIAALDVRVTALETP